MKWLFTIAGWFISFFLNRKKAEGVELGEAQQEVKQQTQVAQKVQVANEVDDKVSRLSDGAVADELRQKWQRSE